MLVSQLWCYDTESELFSRLNGRLRLRLGGGGLCLSLLRIRVSFVTCSHVSGEVTTLTSMTA